MHFGRSEVVILTGHVHLLEICTAAAVVDQFQITAKIESAIPDGLHRCGQSEGGERTVLKGVVSDGAHPAAKDQHLELIAEKGEVTDGFHAVGQKHKLQRKAARKGSVANGNNALGNGDRGNLIAAFKSSGADGGDARSNGHRADRSAVVLPWRRKLLRHGAVAEDAQISRGGIQRPVDVDTPRIGYVIGICCAADRAHTVYIAVQIQIDGVATHPQAVAPVAPLVTGVPVLIAVIRDGGDLNAGLAAVETGVGIFAGRRAGGRKSGDGGRPAMAAGRDIVGVCCAAEGADTLVIAVSAGDGDGDGSVPQVIVVIAQSGIVGGSKNVPLAFAAGKIHLLQGRAAGEGFRLHIAQRGGEMEFFQAGEEGQSVHVQLGQTLGKGNFFQIGVDAVDKAVLKSGHAAFHHHFGDELAVIVSGAVVHAGDGLPGGAGTGNGQHTGGQIQRPVHVRADLTGDGGRNIVGICCAAGGAAAADKAVARRENDLVIGFAAHAVGAIGDTESFFRAGGLFFYMGMLRGPIVRSAQRHDVPAGIAVRSAGAVYHHVVGRKAVVCAAEGAIIPVLGSIAAGGSIPGIVTAEEGIQHRALGAGSVCIAVSRSGCAGFGFGDAAVVAEIAVAAILRAGGSIRSPAGDSPVMLAEEFAQRAGRCEALMRVIGAEHGIVLAAEGADVAGIDVAAGRGRSNGPHAQRCQQHQQGNTQGLFHGKGLLDRYDGSSIKKFEKESNARRI